MSQKRWDKQLLGPRSKLLTEALEACNTGAEAFDKFVNSLSEAEQEDLEQQLSEFFEDMDTQETIATVQNAAMQFSTFIGMGEN